MTDIRPNVIFVISDQQRADSLSCYGSEFTDTPNLDRLGAQGAICQRAYCANPVCTPARASIFTGQHLSRHGAWNVGVNIPEDTVMLSHRLSQLGYRTHYIGKTHFQANGGAIEVSRECGREWERNFVDWNGPYYGFETVEMAMGHTTFGLRGHYGLWVDSQIGQEARKSYGKARSVRPDAEFRAEAHDWDLPLRLHNSVWTADRSVAFLERQDGQAPFFLTIGFQDPHHPHCVPTQFKDRVDPNAVALPRFVEGELDDKPPHFLLAHRRELEGSAFEGDFPVAGPGRAGTGRGVPFSDVSEEDARVARAYYYTMVKLLDQQLGRILDCLDGRGLAKNTIVVFTTDHGELLGDHGLWLKGPFHYEELVRIPMVFRWPAVIPPGQRLKGLISQVDLAPTILAAVGEEIPRACDGVDALPMLQSSIPSTRNHAFVECTDDPRGLRLKTIVTETRKLTYYHGHDFGELYDLDNDPSEVRNLWDAPGATHDKQRLIATILDHMERLEPRGNRLGYA